MTDRELMQQALAVLGLVDGDIEWQDCSLTRKVVLKTIAALRERLAREEPTGKQSLQVEQPEPVAWISKHGVVYPLDAKDEVHPINDLQPLYTAPQRREWVGLSDDEIERACVPLGAAMLSFTEVARAIEAKLREKSA